ncbi:MAG: hypothetical protein JWM72_2923 [Actinomycetia bacterium]|nr:hypothetical protein [Actinomycetes bacterium]
MPEYSTEHGRARMTSAGPTSRRQTVNGYEQRRSSAISSAGMPTRNVSRRRSRGTSRIADRCGRVNARQWRQSSLVTPRRRTNAGSVSGKDTDGRYCTVSVRARRVSRSSIATACCSTGRCQPRRRSGQSRGSRARHCGGPRIARGPWRASSTSTRRTLQPRLPPCESSCSIRSWKFSNAPRSTTSTTAGTRCGVHPAATRSAVDREWR